MSDKIDKVYEVDWDRFDSEHRFNRMYTHDSYDSHPLTFYDVDIEEVDTFSDERFEKAVSSILDKEKDSGDILGP